MSSKRRKTVIAAVIVGVLLIAIVVPFMWYRSQVNSSGSGSQVAVEIPKGSGLSGVGGRLENAGVIGSALAFRVYTKLNSVGAIQAGTYTLRKDMGISRAVDALEKGPNGGFHKLVLPPGLRITQIAERVGKIPGLSSEEFLAIAKSGEIRSTFSPPGESSLEGLTYPDTYFISEGEDEKAILQRLVTQFDKKATEIGLQDATLVSPYQTIIVASLIQTESKVATDSPLISAVVYNRLRDNMPLQIDATLLYAKNDFGSPLTNADKQIDSPYNTYRIGGLPPTPISTVSQASLKAAMNPADVSFKYYVLSEPDGRHKFANTLEEHNANVQESRQKGLL